MWTFNDIMKPTIWGGDRIAKFKNLPEEMDGIGESWELCGLPGSESVVAEGPDKGLNLVELIRKYGSDLMGKKNFAKYGEEFPILIKFIDARQDLSVQVHPDDEMAHRYGYPFGKTEMWYVVDSEPGSKLINGFKEPVNPDDYESLVSGTGILDVARSMEVRPGDAFFIPAGRMHAIGGGAFIAEIQQTSDLTYRLYDYHRKDKNGNERELHTQLAKEALNFNDTEGSKIDYVAKCHIPVNIATSPYFTTNLIDIDSELMRDYSEWDTFVALVCIAGKAVVESGNDKITLTKGHTLLVPALSNGVKITPEGGSFKALEAYVK